MTFINTFSSAVDDVIERSGRPDRKADIIAFVRTSIRECQTKPGKDAKFFRKDFVEDQITATSDGFVWTHPTTLRILRTVRYNILDSRSQYIYPKEKLPGKSQLKVVYYYYGGMTYYAFAGVSNGVIIDVAYYDLLKFLAYHISAESPATYSLESESWSYLTATSDAEKLIARNSVTNWLLFDHYDLIVEGALAKIYKVVDDPRSRSSFALYKDYQSTLVATEPSDSLNK